MKFYSKEGLVEGYMLPLTAAVYSMSFLIEGQTALQLNITDQATKSDSCDLGGKSIPQWLWENGNEIILSESFPYGTSVTVRANDVRNGKIVTSFEALQKEEL